MEGCVMGITIKDVAAAAGIDHLCFYRVQSDQWALQYFRGNSGAGAQGYAGTQLLPKRQRTELCQRHDQNDCGFSKFSSEHSLSESAYV